MKNRKNELFDILSNVLEINSSEINIYSSPETIETWDSYNALLLVTEIEENFNVKFSMEEIYEVKSVLDIISVLKRHEIEIDE